MSALARHNGWRGFDGVGERLRDDSDGKARYRWEYRCDGIPTMWGCPASLVRSTKIKQIGRVRASGGWEAVYGRNDPGDPGDDGLGNDLDVVLVLCPSCVQTMREVEERMGLASKDS